MQKLTPFDYLSIKIENDTLKNRLHGLFIKIDLLERRLKYYNNLTIELQKKLSEANNTIIDLKIDKSENTILQDETANENYF